MPEKTGTVTGLIKKRDGTVFGLNIDGDEYLYSFPEYRGEVFEADMVEVGCQVRVEYQDTEKAGKSKSYISVLEVGDSNDEGEDIPEPTHGDPASAMTGQVSEWGFEQKDRLMCRESCIKSAVVIFAASIKAGIYKTHPDVTAPIAYAEAFEKWCLEAVE